MKCSFLVVCACLVVPSQIAVADEIPNVTIGASGPDQEIPTNKSFFVSGDAGKNTTVVQVAIVRTGSPWIWGGDGPACTKVASEIGIDQPNSEFLDAGVHRIREQFPAATKRRDDRVLLSATWLRPEKDGDKFKVLVATDEAFFAPGYSYCLYVFKKTQKVDDQGIKKLIDSVSKALDACGSKIQAAATLAANPEDDCRTATQAHFDAELAKLLDEANIVSGGKPGAVATCPPNPKSANERDKAYCELRSKINEALKYAVDMFLERKRLDAVLNVKVPARDLDRSWKGEGTDLGAALITMLTNQGSLFPSYKEVKVKGVKTRVTIHLTQDSKIAVTHVSVLDDDLHIRVSNSDHPAGDHVRVLDGVTTKELVVADGITLFDLLQLRKGTLAKDLTLRDLRAIVRATTALSPWSPTDAAPVQSAYSRIALVSDFIASSTPAAFSEWTPIAIRAHVKNWLAADQVLPPKLDVMATNLRQLLEHKPKYDSAAAGLSIVTTEQVQLGAPKAVPFQIAFDQETWVFSYLTPTIGYAQMSTQDGWISKLYTGVQLHFAPNPVDRPLWRHGFSEDWKRAFAVEAGVATSTSWFGPDDRYRGIFGLPTVYLGVVLHIVPYTSITVGKALVERRSTLLTVENPSVAAPWFIGLNVQVNVPDLIHKQHTTTAATAMPPSGGK